jgi:hypothetical protein
MKRWLIIAGGWRTNRCFIYLKEIASTRELLFSVDYNLFLERATTEFIDLMNEVGKVQINWLTNQEWTALMRREPFIFKKQPGRITDTP